MNLKDLLYKVPIEEVQGSTTKTVNQIHFDSRKIETNDIFVAIRGTLSDGHQYIEKAISLGATTIICEQLPKTCLKNITYIKVQDTNTALAQLANNFYEKPSNKLILVGVTGTNGKTTIASLLYQMFKRAGYKVGLLSTVKIMVNTTEYKATHTTPDSLTINHFLNQMVQEGCEYCFMEVSSHGVHQKRTEGLFFAGGVFTNLSHDHLDYHSTFAEYRDVKKMFFDHLPKTAFALTNIDDKNGSVMLQNTQARKKTYALKTYADYKAVILENQLSGLQLKINEQDVWTRLIGTFNAYNLLAIYAVAVELGIDKIEALRLLSELESVSGRFQFIVSKEKITTIVDYAHTPDALENVLNTINDIRTKNEQLITIVGCGGDRDRTKRPIMARIATEMSSKVILTSDNPRTENPQAIIEEMEAGITAENFKKYVSIIDRKQAIKTACQIAENGDIILIAGKGHETYQEVNGIRHDFDDMKIVQELLKQLNK
ncbi:MULTISPECIES: UDP-N-acetylmuramoyl-L-alanyl-D-glutamate--2,6-diaminopimelate ligase [Flavobacterium]|uniref:UDP-N-acetylmuramoyl-L-alanyl-D-glutamate--2,6-diaminopimelate ligase n=1 Tax=Flavobacterium columnare TaxID=996 RepID=A0AA94F5D0_9FLAO|nr:MULTISPECIES: UDP-N-acetylmuramoyl-L-alanyl-D-glutamate--2,6-diaminopimelate ligase [Flavobacterium]MCH4833998.1 UDP-N-acetylmuramoyl-L-alanyl-D-glutamate--2,6-diaminopimelate ligase [Flavobacterium columnare]QYS91515.1 UDP-N-acetylmuramoyl-L-alanyl-D-glutamate--2,6-diaminopimelate ligase [Flavobacterium covae]